MTPLRRILLLPLAVVLLAACGMKNSPSMAPNSAAQSSSYGQPPGHAAQAAAAPYAEAPPPAATQAPSSVGGQPAPGATPGEMSRHGETSGHSLEQSPADLPSALRLLDDEAKALSGAMPLCATACRSLGSMERAARVVCELTREGEPARCDQARQKLREARERVRKGCGACENGPRTDPDAPGP